jgi:hypothetical protein
VLRETRDADARPNPERLAVHDKRTLDFLKQLRRRRHAAVEIGPGQDQRELVAAEPRHRVDVAERAAQARRDELEHAIAGVVPQRVVDLLEPIEIHHEQRERLAGAMRAEHGLLETIVQ